jgi:dipeptidyl aminopeptidase/acylaminoacyl peptidase
MDVDGPLNDKGLYAMVAIRPQTTVRKEDVIAWSTFGGKLGGKLRVGFMSQVSPDGQRVVTTINDPGAGQPDYQRRKNPLDLMQNYFVANFKDYRFLQVFYPTRGILAWYDKAAGQLQPLPGADDPGFVHTDAVWSPDGKYLVFARAAARDAYPAGGRMAESANDANETRIQYDLYRIPFRDGQGGKAEPIVGASANGMSNSFPKISPDGRWIVYVQARNGQLMRPDSRLFIVPAAGGVAREMRCNTADEFVAQLFAEWQVAGVFLKEPVAVYADVSDAPGRGRQRQPGCTDREYNGGEPRREYSGDLSIFPGVAC